MCNPFFQFKEISFAYEVLSSADKRELYDRHGLQGLKEGGGPGGGKYHIKHQFSYPVCEALHYE